MTWEYTPLPRWASGHRMTVHAWARRRCIPDLPAPDARIFDVGPDTRVLAHCHWQPAPTTRLVVLLLHGLESSSDAHYIRGLAAKAWARGWNVVRLNQRTCGGTEHLSRGLYHSGLTADPLAVLTELRERDGFDALAMVGYSLGGNLALKLAGELGEERPPWLRAVAAVSPVMELETCVRAIERRENRLYEWNFCRSLQARMRRKAKAWPGDFDLKGLWRIWSIRDFDERYTAPHHGFAGATDYYHRASAMRTIDGVRTPTLILTAEDDPFVPPDPFRTPAVTGNAHITTLVTPHGGHCGFMAEPNGYDGYWAEQVAIEFVAQFAEGAGRRGDVVPPGVPPAAAEVRQRSTSSSSASR